MVNDTPCVGVSTLETIAYGGISAQGALLCAVMDARCGQVYNALFQVENGKLKRLTDDRALSIAVLEEECRPYGDRVLLLGDGAALCHKTFGTWGARLAPETIRFQRASSVALLGEEIAQAGNTISASALAPVYLRLPPGGTGIEEALGTKGASIKSKLKAERSFLL